MDGIHKVSLRVVPDLAPSDTTKQKIREANLGKVLSKETREKMSKLKRKQK
jgi:NUMOD3 motif